MKFEVKKVEAVGGIKAKDIDNSTQFLNITVGVVGCPYDDISTTKIVEYDFSNSITVADAKAGIQTFSAAWVVANYPNI